MDGNNITDLYNISTGKSLYNISTERSTTPYERCTFTTFSIFMMIFISLQIFVIIGMILRIILPIFIFIKDEIRTFVKNTLLKKIQMYTKKLSGYPRLYEEEYI